MERKMERNIVNIDENEKKKGGAEEKKINTVAIN